MKKLVLERFDGSYAYCEDSDKKLFAIDKKELPPGAASGDVLSITDEGIISVDQKETDARNSRPGKKSKKR